MIQKLGFIAQEVNEIDTRLVFINQNDGLMGIHIDGIIPLLVEAIKNYQMDLYQCYYQNNRNRNNNKDNNILLNFGGNLILPLVVVLKY